MRGDGSRPPDAPYYSRLYADGAAAVGECGPRNLGASLVVDPLGVAIAQAGEQEALVFADLDPARIAHARDVLPVLKNRRFARPELA